MRLWVAPLALGLIAAATPCRGYFAGDEWLVTATDGAVALGEPITLTWGIVPDGTFTPNVSFGQGRNSDLIAALDSFYGGGTGPLSNRPWFAAIESSFDRWTELTGVNFVYEPNDDGQNHTVFAGQLGVRADIRLAGAFLDGTSGSSLGVAAFAIEPDNGDIFLDTGDSAYYSDPAGNSFGLRHTLMHEIGHSLGLRHINSTNAAILMEPQPQTSFDGPQIDDIRGVQFLYGDARERNGGDDTPATATSLGAIALDEVVSVGVNGDGGQSVQFTETDFASIHRTGDIDHYTFTAPADATVEVVLEPVGARYNQRFATAGPFTNINASDISNLALQVSDSVSQIGQSDTGGLGDTETVSFTTDAAGTFTVAISGGTNASQLYRLDISVQQAPLVGDYNDDGFVNAADYTVWRDNLNSTTQLDADGDGSGTIDGPDYAVWASAYGDSRQAAVAVPEPGACFTSLLAISLGVSTHRRSGRVRTSS